MAEPKKTKKAQLHQLLAVENDRKSKANMIMKEAIVTFTKKQDHFDGLSRVYQPKEESGQTYPSESKEIVTTVGAKLHYCEKTIINAIDAQLSKEQTNNGGEAKAELVIDNISFGELSATGLLALEQQMTNLREMYHAIPTLDPALAWDRDAAAGKGKYRSAEERRTRTDKRHQALVLHPPTKEHPAQTQMIMKDVVVGEWVQISKSGRLTPADKSLMLGRIDDIIDAVKKTRARANQAQIINVKIGKKILDFINKDVV